MIWVLVIVCYLLSVIYSYKAFKNDATKCHENWTRGDRVWGLVFSIFFGPIICMAIFGGKYGPPVVERIKNHFNKEAKW